MKTKLFALGCALGGLFYNATTQAAAVVYVGTDGNNAREYDAATGAENAVLDTGGGTSLAVSDSYLFVGTANTVRKFDIATGAFLSVFEYLGTNALAVSGNYLFSARSGSLRKFDIATGTLIPEFEGPFGGKALAVAGNDLFLARETSVLKFDATTGALVPSFTLGMNNTGPTGIAATGDSLFLGNVSGLREFDAASGSLIRNYSLGHSVTALAVAGGNIYVASPGFNVQKFDIATGALIPEFQGVFGSAALAATPEPTAALLAYIGFGLLACRRNRKTL